MKNLLTKKAVLLICVAGTILFLAALFSREIGLCPPYSRGDCSDTFDQVAQIFLPILLPLIFSLITYKMREEVFEHWIKFAIWGIPVLIVLTYLILGGASNGGLGIGSSYGSSFDALLFILLYGTFCSISIYRIVSAYNHSKHGKE